MGKLAPKVKLHQINFKNLNSRYLEGAEYKSDTSIIRYFIQNLNLGKSFPKLKPRWGYLKNCTWANLKVIKTNMTVIYYEFLSKIQLGKLIQKIKVSLSLHENSHNRRFKDSEYKYDIIKRFLNSVQLWGSVRPVFV